MSTNRIVVGSGGNNTESAKIRRAAESLKGKPKRAGTLEEEINEKVKEILGRERRVSVEKVEMAAELIYQMARGGEGNNEEGSLISQEAALFMLDESVEIMSKTSETETQEGAVYWLTVMAIAYLKWKYKENNPEDTFISERPWTRKGLEEAIGKFKEFFKRWIDEENDGERNVFEEFYIFIGEDSGVEELIGTVRLDDHLEDLKKEPIFEGFEINGSSGDDLDAYGALAYIVPTEPPRIYLPESIVLGRKARETLIGMVKELRYVNNIDLGWLMYYIILTHETLHKINRSFTIDIRTFPWGMFGLELVGEESREGRISKVKCKKKDGDRETVEISGWGDILGLVEYPSYYRYLQNVVEDCRVNSACRGTRGTLLKACLRKIMCKDINEKIDNMPGSCESEDEKRVAVQMIVDAFVYGLFAGFGKILFDEKWMEPEEAKDRILERIRDKFSPGELINSAKYVMEEAINAYGMLEEAESGTVSDSAGPAKRIYDAMVREFRKEIEKKNGQKNDDRKKGKESEESEDWKDRIREIIAGDDVTKDYKEEGTKVSPRFEDSREGREGKGRGGEDSTPKTEKYMSLGYSNPLREEYSVKVIHGGENSVEVGVEDITGSTRERTIPTIDGRLINGETIIRGTLCRLTGRMPEYFGKTVQENSGFAVVVLVDLSGSMGNMTEIAAKAAAKIKCGLNKLDIVEVLGFTTDEECQLLLNRFTVEKRNRKAVVRFTDFGGGTPIRQAYSEAVKILEDGKIGTESIFDPGVDIDTRVLVVVGDFEGYEQERLEEIHRYAEQRRITTIGLSTTEKMIKEAFDYTGKGLGEGNMGEIIRSILKRIEYSTSVRRF